MNKYKILFQKKYKLELVAQIILPFLSTAIPMGVPKYVIIILCTSCGAFSFEVVKIRI